LNLTLYFDLEAKQNKENQTVPQSAVFLVSNGLNLFKPKKIIV
jgi:hypothetical protein